MKKLARTVLACWFIGVATVVPLIAQRLPFQLKQYGIEDGLSHRKVYGAVQDEAGYLWVGTEDGVNRFDGYEFRVFGNILDTAIQFAGNTIYHVTLDNKGILWLGTNKGISLFNPRTFESRNVLIAQYPISNFDLHYRCYAHPDGTVWVNHPIPQGVEIRQYKEYRPSGKVIRPKYARPGDNPVNAEVVGDSRGNTWIRFFRELVWINADGEINHYPVVQTPEAKNYWLSITLDDQGQVLLVHGNQMQYRFKPKDGTFECVSTCTPKAYWGRTFPKVFYANARELWLFDWPNYLTLYDPVNLTIRDISKPFFDKVRVGLIGQIYKDRDQNIWICSENGLFKTQRKPQFFHSFLQSESADFATSCRKIMETADGKILIGTYSGLFEYKKNEGEKHISIESPNSFVPYFLIKDPVHSDIIWAGGEGKGKVHRINLRNNTKRDIRSSEEKVYELEIENETTLWVSSSSGLELFDITTETFTPYQDPAGKFDFTKIITHDIFKNNRGEVWLGTSEGLFRIDRNQGVKAHFSLQKPGDARVSVLYIYEQSDSIFWLGTKGSGLFRLNRQSGNFRQFTTNEGLPNNVIYAILDYGDYLWMSSDNGLSRLHLPTMRFDNFTVADGLAHREFNNKSYLKASDSTFYFGGINGVTYFKPEGIQLAKSQNKILISLYTRDDGANKQLLIQDTDLDQLKTIRLGYRDRFFTLQIALNNFTNPERNTYAYTLEGFDEQWNDVGAQRILRFNGLPPGTYTLKIKGADGNRVWSDIRSIQVIVELAFYKTWWFLTLCGFLIFGLSYGIFRYRLARLREMEQMRTRIASDLHDEVGSMLTRIAMQAQLAEHKADEKDKSFLRQVAENSRVAISTMRDVIWTIDSRNDSVAELLERMEDFAHAMLGPQGLTYFFKADTLRRDSLMDVKIRQNLYLIYKEAVNNIVKHANAKNVEIELKNEAGFFYMKIANDGVTEKNTLPESLKGQGLRNMEMRANRINATIHINTQEGFEILLKRKAFV